LLSQGASEKDLVWLLFEAACAELARRNARLRGYWFLPVKARLATFLFELGDGIGEKSERGLAVHLPMFRDEIANYLGTRTETICRVLNSWKDKGLIVMESPRNLVIPDSALLRADAFAQQRESP
jgi:CRP/FNR family transcriptional regulator